MQADTKTTIEAWFTFHRGNLFMFARSRLFPCIFLDPSHLDFTRLSVSRPVPFSPYHVIADIFRKVYEMLMPRYIMDFYFHGQ